MTMRRDILIKYMILICAAVIAALAIVATSSVTMHICVFLIICILAAGLVNYDLLHPYCWFSAFFGLYSVGHPIRYALGENVSFGYTKDVMLYQLLALVVALIIITPNKSKINIDMSRYTLNIGVFNKIIYVFLILMMLLGAGLVSVGGFMGKADVYSSGNIFLTIIFRLPLIMSLLYGISVVSAYAKTGKLPIRQMIATGCVLLIITMFSGERDFIFRFLIISILILWFTKKINLKHMLFLIPIGVMIVPLSATFKYFFLRGETYEINQNIISAFLYGEFESASRNLQVLVNDGRNVNGIKGFSQLLLDIASCLSSEIESCGNWFHNTYYANSISGYGFTLVGEGYIIAGWIGIIVVFIIAGFLMRWMYNIAFRNLYSLVGYFYFVTVVIYAIRGDLATIYTALLKQIGLVILVLYMMEKMSKRKMETEKRDEVLVCNKDIY